MGKKYKCIIIIVKIYIGFYTIGRSEPRRKLNRVTKLMQVKQPGSQKPSQKPLRISDINGFTTEGRTVLHLIALNGDTDLFREDPLKNARIP